MTVKERVLVSRLIQKIDHQRSYAKSIGIDYTVTSAQTAKGKANTHIVKTDKVQ